MEVILGTIVGVFGIKGQVKVKSNTDFATSRFKKGKEIDVYSPIKKTRETLKITSHSTSRNLNILSFENIDNPDVAAKYIGYQILIDKPNNDLKKGEYYYADLWHCKVYHHDELIGEVIDLFDGGAHLILRIKRENKKDLLYPFVDKFVDNVDVENKKIFITPLKGMID